MAKMQKLYRLNLGDAKTLNIAHFNPTCKAILKAMYRLEKKFSDTDYKGSTGEDVLKFAVEQGLWTTRQDPSKFHTTWAYYVKKLKEEAGIFETGSVRGMSTEEYLEDEDMEEEIEWSDDDRAVAKAEDDHQAAMEEAA